MWYGNEEERMVGEVLEGQPKPQTLSMQLQNITYLYVSKNH